jgi:hypothetical protein
MKTYITLALALILSFCPVLVHASCTMHTLVTPDGRMITCQTCCYYGGNCYTTCF